MSLNGPSPPPAREGRFVAISLSLLALLLCGWLAVDLIGLVRLRRPPALVAGPPAATLPPGERSPQPPTAAEVVASPPALGLPPEATTTAFALPVLSGTSIPGGHFCQRDRVVIEAAEPASGATLATGSGVLSATVAFCLQSLEAATLTITLVPSQSPPDNVPFGGPALIRAGDGRWSQQLDWAAAPWPAEWAGSFRLVAAIIHPEHGSVLASAFGGQYEVAPP